MGTKILTVWGLRVYFYIFASCRKKIRFITPESSTIPHLQIKILINFPSPTASF